MVIEKGSGTGTENMKTTHEDSLTASQFIIQRKSVLRVVDSFLCGLLIERKLNMIARTKKKIVYKSFKVVIVPVSGLAHQNNTALIHNTHTGIDSIPMFVVVVVF